MRVRAKIENSWPGLRDLYGVFGGMGPYDNWGKREANQEERSESAGHLEMYCVSSAYGSVPTYYHLPPLPEAHPGLRHTPT